MALIHTYFMSEVLNMERSVDVILPMESLSREEAVYPKEGSIPVLYLLHGMSDDHTMWGRRTSLERYLENHQLAVVMPAAEISFYSDMKYGYDYFQYFSRELPEVMHRLFPQLSTRREHTSVAGLSMGGFGAFKLALNCPERFSYAASLSGVLDLASASRAGGREFLDDIVGSPEEIEQSENDLPYLLEEHLKKGTELPELYMCCGQQDFLYEINQAFYRRFAGRTQLDFLEEPGAHTWDFWDRNIARIIERLTNPV